MLQFTSGKFTFQVDPTCLYTTEGLWLRHTDHQVRIGLSDFLQQRSGDIAFLEVKPSGATLATGDELATVETIKINLSLVSPVNGTITTVNPLLDTAPETINQDPYGKGWLCEMDTTDWDTNRQKLIEPVVYFAKIQREVENEAK